MKPNIAKVILVSAVMLCAQQAIAQPYSIDQHTLIGGGGTSTGGVFAVTGAIGPSDANAQRMAGGSFSITGGFWSLVAIQTPGAPSLSIVRLGADVRLFWPLPATDFVLYQSPAITGAWSQVPFPYATNATDISIDGPAPTENRFYRLQKP